MERVSCIDVGDACSSGGLRGGPTSDAIDKSGWGTETRAAAHKPIHQRPELTNGWHEHASTINTYYV